MTKVRKAVLPVAGLGTRMLPGSLAVPKGLFLTGNCIPVVHRLVQEMRDAGIEQVVMVLSEGQEAIPRYFGSASRLRDNLKKKGKEKELAQINEIRNMLDITYIEQFDPRGDGDAILQTKDIIGNEAFAILYGDDIIDSPKPAIGQLIDVYNEKQMSVICLEEIEGDAISNYGVIDGEKVGDTIYKINELVEKPKPQDAPSNLGIIGKYVCTPQIFDALKHADTSPDGEIRLIDGLKILKQSQEIYGVIPEGIRFDCGSKIGLLKANIHFGLKDAELKGPLQEYLRTLDLE